MNKEDLIAEINHRIAEHKSCKKRAEFALADLTINGPENKENNELLRGAVLINSSAATILEDLEDWIDKTW